MRQPGKTPCAIRGGAKRIIVWNPFGLFMVAVALVVWALAAVVYLAKPKRSENRRFAMALGFEGAAGAAAGGLTFMSDVTDTWHAWQMVGITFAIPVVPLYLYFLSTQDSPFARALRHNAAKIGMVLFVVVFETIRFVNPEAWHGPLYNAWYATVDARYAGPARIALAIVALTMVYALAVTYTAWRRAPANNAARTKAGFVFAAFGIRDALIALIVLTVLLPLEARYWDLAWLLGLPIAYLVFTALATYGIVQAQLFDIEARINKGVAGTVALGAAFLIGMGILQTLQGVADGATGSFLGGISAGAVLIMAPWLRRMGGRVADRTVPVPSDARTAENRRRVYQAEIVVAYQNGPPTPDERAALDDLVAQFSIPAAEARALEDEVVRGLWTSRQRPVRARTSRGVRS